jgi:hypothetical protein
MSSHTETMPVTTIHGVAAEYDEPETLVEAVKKARAAGYRKMDAYTPFPVHGLAEALEFHDWRIPWAVFLAGCAGAVGGYMLQYYVSVIDYPLNVGGRPLNSWPQFIPVTFECTILFAAITAVLCAVVLNGLPQPYHPIFNAPNFDLASQDRFFLCIESDDPKFDTAEVERLLNGTGAVAVSEVEK